MMLRFEVKEKNGGGERILVTCKFLIVMPAKAGIQPS